MNTSPRLTQTHTDAGKSLRGFLFVLICVHLWLCSSAAAQPAAGGQIWTNYWNAWRATNAGKPDVIMIGHSVPAGYADNEPGPSPPFCTNYPPTNNLGPNNLTNFGGYSPQDYNNQAYGGTNQDSGNTNANMGYVMKGILGGYLNASNWCYQGSTMNGIYTREVVYAITNNACALCFLQGGVWNDYGAGTPTATTLYWLNQIAAQCQSCHVPFFVSEETPGGPNVVGCNFVTNWNTVVLRDWGYTNIYGARVVRGLYSLLSDSTGQIQQTPVQLGNGNNSPHLNTNGIAVTSQFWLTTISNVIVAHSLVAVTGNVSFKGNLKISGN